MPRLACPVLAGWRGEAATDSRSGVKADPVIISTLPKSPSRACPVLTGWAKSFIVQHIFEERGLLRYQTPIDTRTFVSYIRCS